jgi:hypothetical protein
LIFNNRKAHWCEHTGVPLQGKNVNYPQDLLTSLLQLALGTTSYPSGVPGGALKSKPSLPTFAATTEAIMPEDFCLESVTTRIPPSVLAVVERVAEAERRSVSSVLRNALQDWARQAAKQQRVKGEI